MIWLALIAMAVFLMFNVYSKYQPIEDDGSRHAVECRYPGCGTRTIWCEQPEDAAERWNKRVPVEPLLVAASAA